MELVAAGWFTMKWLNFDQTIRNFTSGDLKIPLVVIQLRQIGKENWENGEYDFSGVGIGVILGNE